MQRPHNAGSGSVCRKAERDLCPPLGARPSRSRIASETLALPAFRHGFAGKLTHYRNDVMTVALLISMSVGFHRAEATPADHLYAMALAGGVDGGSGWYGLELGVEYDRYRPHDIVGGVLGLVPGTTDESDLEITRGVSGFGGFFLGYRLRPKWPCSPFVGVTAVESFPGLDNSYITLNPETGFSFPVWGRFGAGMCFRYGFSTDGRSSDVWMCGIGITYHCR